MSDLFKGPWGWEGSTDGKEIRLVSTGGRWHYLMGFRRWGMQGAQPFFPKGGALHKAETLVKFEVGNPAITGVKNKDASVYRTQIRDIDSPIAQAIVLIPEMLGALKEGEGIFRHYGDLHAAKPDEAKAARNYEQADKMKALISRIEGEV